MPRTQTFCQCSCTRCARLLNIAPNLLPRSLRIQPLQEEIKDYEWDDATIDLLGLSLLRSAVLALCFFMAEAAAKDAGKVSWSPASGKVSAADVNTGLAHT